MPNLTCILCHARRQSLLRKDNVTYKITPVSSFTELIEGLALLSDEADEDEVRPRASAGPNHHRSQSPGLVAWL